MCPLLAGRQERKMQRPSENAAVPLQAFDARGAAPSLKRWVESEEGQAAVKGKTVVVPGCGCAAAQPVMRGTAWSCMSLCVHAAIVGQVKVRVSGTCRRGYDMVLFAQAGAARAVGVEISPSAVRCPPRAACPLCAASKTPHQSWGPPL